MRKEYTEFLRRKKSPRNAMPDPFYGIEDMCGCESCQRGLTGLIEPIGVSTPMVSINGYMGISRETLTVKRINEPPNPLNDYDMLRGKR